MRPEDFFHHLKRQPFRPFRIDLSNGRTYEVYHPELAAAGKSTVHIYRLATGYVVPVFDDYEVISLLHINSIEHLSPEAAPTTDGNGQQ